jgi:hypothetical protein
MTSVYLVKSPLFILSSFIHHTSSFSSFTLDLLPPVLFHSPRVRLGGSGVVT